MSFELEAVVARLTTCVPEVTHLVYTEPGWVEIAYQHESPAWVGISAQLSRGDYSGAVWNLLSSIQDHVTRELRKPWPELRGNLALPQVYEHDGVLHAWYGSETEVVLDIGEFPI